MTMSFLVLPFAGQVERAQASTSLSGYIQQLTPTILKLPGCKKVLNGDSSTGGGTGNLFSGITKLFSKSTSSTPQLKDYTNLNDTATQAGITSDSISVTDQNANKKLDTALEKLKSIQKSEDKTQKSTENQDTNQNCLNAIGKAVAKILIDDMTMSTIQWIQTGNSGGPLFVQEPGKYFAQIAETQILGFGLDLNSKELYPFAQNFLQGVKNRYQSSFTQNAQYSLNTLIQNGSPEFSAQTFATDFSQGGWNAWDAMTQNPQNNPLGFNLMASNELQSRLESSASQAQSELLQGNGFIGEEKCADPEGVTKDQDQAALKGDPNGKRCNRWEYITPGKLIGDQLVSAVDKKDHALLDVQTLNDAVAAILDAVLNKFTSKLQNSQVGLAGVGNITQDYSGADEFGNVSNKRQIENDFAPFQISASTWLAQNPDFNIRTDLSQALIDEQRIYMDKLTEQNTELNSTTDGKAYNPAGTFCAKEGGTCSLPDTTHPQIVSYGANGQYLSKTVTGSIACNVASFGGDPIYGVQKTCSYGPTNAYGLVPTIYQLDYCIPGPHPNWEQDAQTNFDNIKSKILNTTGMDFMQISTETGRGMADWVKSIYGLLKSFGLAIDTGTFDSYAAWMGTGAACKSGPSITECVNRLEYHPIILALTGIDIRTDGGGGGFIESYDNAITLLDRVFDDYVNAIHNVYIPQVLPSVAKDAAAEFDKIDGYNQIIKNNETKIASLKTSTEILKGIKKAVDQLNTDLANGEIKDENGHLAPSSDILDADGNIVTMGQQSQYEENLKPWIVSFGRISTDMVSGDDIASADSLLKEIITEKKYVHDELLTGTNGCETEMATWAKDPTNSPLPVQLSPSMQDRPNYPLPILYRYPDDATKDQNKLLRRSFLYYGVWSSAKNWGVDPNEGTNAMALCNFYGKFGQEISKCNDITQMAGPNVLPVGDLFNWPEGDETRLLKNVFEQNTIKIY